MWITVHRQQSNGALLVNRRATEVSNKLAESKINNCKSFPSSPWEAGIKMQQALFPCSHERSVFLQRDRPLEGHAGTADEAVVYLPQPPAIPAHTMWAGCGAELAAECRTVPINQQKEVLLRGLFTRARHERGKKNRPSNSGEQLPTKPLAVPWCRLWGTRVRLESLWVWLCFSNHQLRV